MSWWEKAGWGMLVLGGGCVTGELEPRVGPAPCRLGAAPCALWEAGGHGMVWVGSWRSPSAPLPHFPVEQAAPNPIQLVLERFQGWGMLLKWCLGASLEQGWQLGRSFGVSPKGTVGCELFPSSLSSQILFFPLLAG